MATDLATLSVRVTQAGIAETTASLEGLSVAAGHAYVATGDYVRAGANANQISQLTGMSLADAREAMARYGGTTAETALEVQGLALAQKEMAIASMQAAAATTEVSTAATVSISGLGRLRQSVATLSAHAVGVSPIFGRLGSTMGSSLGISSLGVIAVLAGVAAIAYAWKALESDADKFADKVADTMKRARDARSGAQLGTADDQIAVAQRAVANAQRELARAQAGSFDGAGAKTGIATVDEADVARQKHILDQALIDLSDWQIKKSQLDYASSLEGASTEARNLALLVSSNHATEAERQRALNLYRSNEAEIAKLGQSQTDNVRRAALIQDDATLRTALHPATTATDDNRLAGIADQIKRMHDEASSFGKDASITTRVASIVDELTRLDASFKQQEASGKLSAAAYQKDAAAITAMKTAAEDAGVALLTAADARVTASIDGQYQATLQLYNAVVDQTGAYHELTAAKSAQLAISQKELELGHALTGADKQKIEATYRLTAQITEAHTAQQQAAEAAKRDSAQQEKLLEQPFVNAIQSIQRAGASFFENLFTPGRNAAQQFWDDFKTLAIKTFADILSMDFMEKILGASTKGGLASSLAGMFGISTAHTSASATIPGVGTISAISPEQYAGLDAFAKAFPTGMQRHAGQAGEGIAIAGAGFGVGSMVGGFAQSHGLGMAGAIGGGALSGAATGAAIGAMGGPIGVVAGAFIGGVAGAVGGLLGFKHSAEEAAKALAAYQLAQDSVADSLAQWRAQITGTAADQKAAALLDLQVKYDQIQKTINETEAGKKHEAQRNLDLATATDLYNKQKTAIENNTAAWNQNTGAINTVQGYRYESLYYGSMPVVPPSRSSGGDSGDPNSPNKDGDLMVHVSLDGTVIARAVLKKFQNAAKRSGKGDTTQWSTIMSVN